MSRRRPLEQSFDQALRNLEPALRPNTINGNRVVIHSFLRHLRATYPEVRRVSQLRRDPHLLGWSRSLCEPPRHLTPGSRQFYLLRLRRLLCELGNHPGARLRPDLLILPDDFPRRDQYLPKPLSPEDDQRLIQQLCRVDNLSSNVLLLLRATGMRIGECLCLAPDCLRHLGQQQWALHVPVGKLHTERWIPVDDPVRRIVERIQSLRDASGTATNSPFLIPQPKGFSRTCDLIRRDLRKAARAAGCTTRCHPHRLRHTFATEMLRAGIGLPALMQLLGHKSLEMTLHYVEITQADLQRQFHTARHNISSRHSIPQLPAPSSPDILLPADLGAAARSLCAARHVLEMCRRAFQDRQAARKLQRLQNRIAKVTKELADLGPEK
jgi:integrase